MSSGGASAHRFVQGKPRLPNLVILLGWVEVILATLEEDVEWAPVEFADSRGHYGSRSVGATNFFVS